MYIDSIASATRPTQLQNIESYFNEVLSIYDSQRNTIDDILSINIQTSPKQNNSDDCGVFMIAAAEKIAKNENQFKSRINLHQKIFSVLTYNQSQISNYRSSIKTSILNYQISNTQ